MLNKFFNHSFKMTMSKLLFSSIIMSILILSCSKDKNKEEQVNNNDILRIKMTLENLALDNLKDWEPPFNEDKFLQDFTQSIDFKFTVDGYHINDFEKWETIVYESMEFDRVNHKQYKHSIKDIQTTVLSINSGVVTINYIWDYITNDDLHYKVPATVTSVYRFEDKDWKIINSHVSHGEKRLLED